MSNINNIAHDTNNDRISLSKVESLNEGRGYIFSEISCIQGSKVMIYKIKGNEIAYTSSLVTTLFN